jgi:hypothetical protein
VLLEQVLLVVMAVMESKIQLQEQVLPHTMPGEVEVHHTTVELLVLAV